MAELLRLLCVVLTGMLLGGALVAWVVYRVGSSLSYMGSFLYGFLRTASLRTKHEFLSTVDDEGRLVRIPIERLAESLRTQLPLWEHLPAERPPPFGGDPTEGST